MNFSFSYAPGTSLSQMIGFETAGRLWSSYLTDNVRINIYVEPTNTLPVGVAGGALMGIAADRPYSTWRTRLAADRKTTTDQVVHRNLPSNTSSFTAWVNDIGPDGSVTSNKSQQSSTKLNISRANAKSLGLINGQSTALDGYVLMNNQLPSLGLNWNYGVGGIVPNNRVHFLSVAVHEIGHVLGFYSGVDASGWQITPIEGFYDDGDEEDGGSGERDPRGPLQNATGLDMFRFSNEDQIDLVIGGSPFFSFNGGTTKRADFSTGVNRNLGGDGYQASHWKSNGGALGIMEPSIAPGQIRSQRALDRQALDAIGWDLGTTTQVNLTTLRNQARASLASRLGVTVAQLDANPALAQQLTQNRSQDAIAMIEQSQIYEWRWSRRGRRTGYWDSIDLPPARTASYLTSNTRNNLATKTLETGWGKSAPNPDSLTTTGSIQSRSTSNSQQNIQPENSIAGSTRSVIANPSLGHSSSIAPMDVLSPHYLIGSELLQPTF